MIYFLMILAPSVVSALISYSMLNWWTRTAPELGFLGRDMNKPGEVFAVEAGGLWVVLSIVFGIMTYIAIDTYAGKGVSNVPLLSICLTVLLAGLLGFVDDVLGWKKGVSPAKRVLLTAPVALPLVVVKAGQTVIDLPILGVVDLGLAYSLILVPLGVVGASNAFNMVAGYNGLESLQAMVLLTSSTVLMALKGELELAYVVVPALSPILVFYVIYNRYPAKVFPGNSFTYGVGALYASLAIYWNFEKYAVMSFILYFAELVLFLRGLLHGVYKENFGRVNPDGSLDPPYERSYSITHLAIKIAKTVKGNCYEKDVVKIVVLTQIIICVISAFFTLS